VVGLRGARDAADVPVPGGGRQRWGSGHALQFAVQPAIGEHYTATGPGAGRERCCVRGGPDNGALTPVDQIASFNISSGSPNWTYQAPAGDTLTIVEATGDGGITINDSTAGILPLDTTGNNSGSNAIPSSRRSSGPAFVHCQLLVPGKTGFLGHGVAGLSQELKAQSLRASA